MVTDAMIRFAQLRVDDLQRTTRRRQLEGCPDRERRPRQPRHWANR